MTRFVSFDGTVQFRKRRVLYVEKALALFSRAGDDVLSFLDFPPCSDIVSMDRVFVSRGA